MNEERAVQVTHGARLKEARVYRGFSPEEIARYLGVPQSAIALIESGSRRVSAPELSRLAKLYQTTTESLTGSDHADPEPESIRLLVRAAALSATDRDEVLRFARFLRSTTSKGKHP